MLFLGLLIFGATMYILVKADEVTTAESKKYARRRKR